MQACLEACGYICTHITWTYTHYLRVTLDGSQQQHAPGCVFSIIYMYLCIYGISAFCACISVFKCTHDWCVHLSVKYSEVQCWVSMWCVMRTWWQRWWCLGEKDDEEEDFRTLRWLTLVGWWRRQLRCQWKTRTAVFWWERGRDGRKRRGRRRRRACLDFYCGRNGSVLGWEELRWRETEGRDGEI